VETTAYNGRSRCTAGRPPTGNHNNQVIWEVQAYSTGFAVDPIVELQALGLMNTWLDRIEADSGSQTFAEGRFGQAGRHG
jgi:hypothetical protein